MNAAINKTYSKVGWPKKFGQLLQLFNVKYLICRWNIILIAVIYANHSFAEQLSFKKTQIGNKTKFEYKWENLDKSIQQFDFELDTKSINSNFRHFKALTPHRLRTYSVKKLKEAAAKLDPKKGSVNIKPNYRGVEFEFRSTSREWMEKQSKDLKALYDSSLKEYLTSEYYIEFEPIGYKNKNAVITYKPDHIRFAKESAKPLKPIIDKLSQIAPDAYARQTATFVLSWLQTIPYSTLESRIQSNGSGFSHPLQLLSNNKGDCDSKVTLMASIIKAMYPNLSVIIVYVPDHALIGFDVAGLASDYKLNLEGINYILAEPTGPAQIDFAEISERSKRFIDSGLYQIEKL